MHESLIILSNEPKPEENDADSTLRTIMLLNRPAKKLFANFVFSHDQL